MTTPAHNLWMRLPITLRAIIVGFLIAAVAANVWLLLLLNLGVQLAAVIEIIFLAFFVWWAHGGGPPSASRVARAKAFRHDKLASRRWLWCVAVVVSAASAGICEEIGFRAFMEQPIEQRHGVSVAVFISSFFFLVLHLTTAWASLGMVPIVFGAGVLLGLLAWSAGSLIPGIIGHFVMDVGLFAYWWTGIAGDFTARPITETGVDRPFTIACCV